MYQYDLELFVLLAGDRIIEHELILEAQYLLHSLNSMPRLGISARSKPKCHRHDLGYSRLLLILGEDRFLLKSSTHSLLVKVNYHLSSRSRSVKSFERFLNATIVKRKGGINL